MLCGRALMSRAMQQDQDSLSLVANSPFLDKTGHDEISGHGSSIQPEWNFVEPDPGTSHKHMSACTAASSWLSMA